MVLARNVSFSKSSAGAEEDGGTGDVLYFSTRATIASHVRFILPTWSSRSENFMLLMAPTKDISCTISSRSGYWLEMRSTRKLSMLVSGWFARSGFTAVMYSMPNPRAFPRLFCWFT